MISAEASSAELSSDSESSGDRSLTRNNKLVTAGIIIADVMGAGILGVPRAIAQLGWLLGAIVLTAQLAANVHISLLLWKVRMTVKAEEGPTMVALARTIFRQAPASQRRFVTLVTELSQQLYIFSMLGLYVLSAGKGLGMAMPMVQWCLPFWAFIGCLILLPFAMTARKMGSYQSLIWINILTLCGTVTIPIVYYLSYGTEEVRGINSKVYAMAPVTPGGAVDAFSTFTFAFTSQFMLVEIMAEMEDVAELQEAYLGMAAPFQLTAFLFAGLMGYGLLGDGVHGMINENLPFNVFRQAAAMCLIAHMLISYLIKGVVTCGTAQRLLCESHSSIDDRSFWARTSWALLTAGTLFAAWLFANLVPFFDNLVDLLGATLTPVSCWLVPIALFVRMKYDTGTLGEISVLEWAVLAAELLGAVVLLVYGTWHGVSNTVESWRTLGYPFECHCEGLWAQNCLVKTTGSSEEL